jgi:glucose/arabinose dehydrogenase
MHGADARLTTGQHTLELSAWVRWPRAAPPPGLAASGFTGAAATVDNLPGAPDEAPRGPASFVTADGISLVAREVAEVHSPTAIRFAPDGRLFVAEQEGRIRLVVQGQLLADPALVLDDIVVGPTAGLLGMALDPDFGRTHHVYLIYTARRGKNIEKQVVRYQKPATTSRRKQYC